MQQAAIDLATAAVVAHVTSLDQGLNSTSNYAGSSVQPPDFGS